MSLRWLIFSVALIALLAPLPAFYSRKRRYRTLHALDIERRNGSWWLTWKQVLRFSGHWIELVRGVAASLCLLATVDDLRSVSRLYEKHAAWAHFVVPLAAAILSVTLIGLLFRYPGKAIAPVVFVAATLLVLVPPAVVVPALLLGGITAFTFRSLAAFFYVVSPMLVALGFLLDRLVWPSLAGAVLAITPAVIAFAREHELVIPVRRSGGAV